MNSATPDQETLPAKAELSAPTGVGCSDLLDGERETLCKLVKEHPALSERERKIVIMRFGLEDGHERTLQEIGEAFKVTRERIRQIEAKALRKLRRPAEPSNDRTERRGTATLESSKTL